MPGHRVADTGHMTLVRHDPDDPETRPPRHRARDLRDLGGGVQGRTAGTDPHPSAEQLQRGVQLQAHPHHFVAARAGRVDQVQLRGIVDHHGDGGRQLGIGGEFGVRRAVRGGIRQQDVVEPGTGQPQRLGERERHDARETVPGQGPFEQRTAAYGLAGDPDRFAPGPADQVVGVGVEGVQIHDRDRGVELGGGPVVTGPVGGARSHDGSLPDRITAG